MATYDQKPESKRAQPFSTIEPSPVWSGPGVGWDTAAPTTNPKRFPAAKSGATSKGAGGTPFGEFDTGMAMNDMDADDEPMSTGGSADCHADCVPTGGGQSWPPKGQG